MLERFATPILLKLSTQYPVVVITGPRQAGKSTLSQLTFPEKPYISLEDLDERSFALDDPRGFLNRYPDGAIIDEIQRCPDLISYIQTLVDKKNRPGFFILTGSAQMSLLSAVTQSLAGRAALLTLLPFSFQELALGNVSLSSLEETLFRGSYPPLFNRNIDPNDWYADYLQTYVERDVRQLLNIQDLGTFQRFLKLCAGRVGQLLNLSSLANDCGISHHTASQWINLLEATYIVFRLQPYHRNFSKRLVKAPKLYFYDSGLLCHLLGIQGPSQLSTHSSRGGIFESWVIGELLKRQFNQHRTPQIYFWRDHKGLEVDIVIEHGNQLLPIEVKSGSTIASDWFNSLKKWTELAGESVARPWLIYGGDQSQSRSHVEVLSWHQFLKEFTD